MWEQRQRELEKERRAQEQAGQRVVHKGGRGHSPGALSREGGPGSRSPECASLRAHHSFDERPSSERHRGQAREGSGLERGSGRQEAPWPPGEVVTRGRAPLDHGSAAARDRGRDASRECAKSAAAQDPVRPQQPPQRRRAEGDAAGSSPLGPRQSGEEGSGSRFPGSGGGAQLTERGSSLLPVLGDDRWMPQGVDVAHGSLPNHGLSSSDAGRGSKRGRSGDGGTEGDEAHEHVAEARSRGREGAGVAELRRRSAASGRGSGSTLPSAVSHPGSSAPSSEPLVPEGRVSRSADPWAAMNGRRALEEQQAVDRPAASLGSSEDMELQSFLLSRYLG